MSIANIANMNQQLFCSIIVPTIARSALARSVNSVLEQRFIDAEFEVIVVNDSGQPIPKESWQDSARVQVIATNRRERCQARNAGAAVARGQYLWFLDDDDWMLPGALASFWQLAGRHTEAVWLYGGLNIVNETGVVLGTSNSGLNGNCFAQVMGGAWVPIQASIIQADAFFRVGGYNPFIIGTEDMDLCRRLAFVGDFANMSDPVACLFRGAIWETSTNYLRAPDDTRRSRDDVLSQPGALGRLLPSINGSYWYGRLIRVYFSTIHHNLRQRRVLAACSRFSALLVVAFMAGFRCFSRRFWDGMRAEHVPEALHFLMERLEQKSAAQ